MNTRKKQWQVRVAAFLSLAVAMSTAAWAAGGSKLIINGQVVSNDVRVINGKSYAPLSDIARAMDMSVVPTDGGYEIKKAGGATPIAGLQGKVGDVLFDGKWRFQVLSVDRVDSYRMKYNSTTDYALYNQIAEFEDKVFRPRKGRALIAIKCRITNARNATYSLWTSNSDTRTAIADTDGESHPPMAYDIDEYEPFHSKKLVPGAKTDFTVLFSVPEDITPKDLIFTLRTINNRDKGNDARVSLAEVSLTE